MYDIEALRRKIAKEGLQETLKCLASPDLPESIKKDLTKNHILVGGYPNVELICSLA